MGDLYRPEGLYFKLDKPLATKYFAADNESYNFHEIGFLADAEIDLRKWRNRHVIVIGDLWRALNGTIYPGLQITATIITQLSQASYQLFLI
jgi:hypothetical protein